MIVLSLFDGMSCGQIALREIGCEPDVYYASEIDKYAIAQTQLNFPTTKQLCDILRWREWDIDWRNIDLVLAGSPCQGFSYAGKRLAFYDPRSALFFVFVDILNHARKYNHDVAFMLENVNMKRAYLRVISEYCGVLPVRINSSLVSAQNRDRWYWTNIRTHREGLFGELHSDIPQPDDRHIYLRDVIEWAGVNERYYLSERGIAYITDKTRMRKKFTAINGDKAMCLMEGYESWNGTFIRDDVGLRKMTPVECSRLQTIPDSYTWDCSDAQAYRMLGNGWTIDVIKHILSYIK